MLPPDLNHLLRNAGERVLPPFLGIVDRPTTVAAKVRGKAQNEDLALSLLRRLAEPRLEVCKPLRRDLERRHQALDLLLLGLRRLARALLVACMFRAPALSHVRVQVLRRKECIAGTAEIMLLLILLQHLAAPGSLS